MPLTSRRGFKVSGLVIWPMVRVPPNSLADASLPFWHDICPREMLKRINRVINLFFCIFGRDIPG
jgi:hypothetical protein